MRKLVSGSKGGSTGSPTEAAQSLTSTSYAQILDLISIGPIYGPAVGNAQSWYYNGTPAQNADGTFNFSVQSYGWNEGTLDQTYLPGFPASSSDTAVGVALTSTTPWIFTETNLNINRVAISLSVNALSKTDPTTGDVTGYTVAYQIQLSVDEGAFTTIVDTAFDGVCYNTYTRTHTIPVSGATASYTIRVVRTTPNYTTTPNATTLIQDVTNVVSYTEIVDAQLRYPGCALVGITLDASQFASIPTRSYLYKGLLVNYPSNYNPATRVYSGTWDGTFVNGWTDNPAWIFYDMVLNNRYGAGNWIDATMIDRYSLYTIAQYCDVMVSDGLGGMEPRFRCNCYITSQGDAFAVLQNLASVFRGMAYWAAGSVEVTADMPFDTAYIYTQANTVGPFTYVGSSLKTRYTTAQVTWNDPQNNYNQAIEYVEDADGVALYGINNAQINAFGCTSRGQAQRVGLWTLITSRYETQVCTWNVGLDGTLAQPGQIVGIADASRAGVRMGGRIKAATNTTSVTLDAIPAGAVVGDTLMVNLPSGVAATSTINGISGNTVNVSTGYPAIPLAGAAWAIQSAAINVQLYRVLSVTDQGGIQFQITGTQYNPSKYAAIDDGAAIDVQPITGNSTNVQVPPTNITVNEYTVINQGIADTNMNIAWSAAAGAVAYTVQWQKDSGEWVTAGTTGGLSINVPGIYTGSYLARVSAINAFSIASPFAYSTVTAVQGKTGAPPVVATFTASTDQVFAIALQWAFPVGAADTSYSEIYYSQTNDFTTATEYSRFSYPTNTANLLMLAAGVSLFFWIRLVDTTGNVGAFYPAQTGPGVNGQSNADGTTILTYLTAQITASQLGAALLAPIEAIPGLQTTVANMSSTVTENTNAITNEVTQRETADAELAQQIATISATYVTPPMAGAPSTFAGATTIYAGVWSELTARAQADQALASSVNTVTAQVQSGVSNANASINTTNTALATLASSTATQITTIQSNVGANTAAIQTTNTAVTNLTNSTATSISNIQAAAGITNANVQTNANAYAALNGAVSASYQIKTQITANGRTYIAGIGVGVNNSSGIVESQVLVSASTFAVLDPNGTAVTSPFTIVGGQTFINQAFIGTGYITNAMIGGAIQSNALGANGQPQWIIDKNGGLTMNGPAGAGYMTLSNSTLQVFDSAGTLRVRVGLW